MIKLSPLYNEDNKYKRQGMTIEELVSLAYKFSNQFKIIDEETMRELTGIGHKYLNQQQINMIFITKERNNILLGN